jgi:hypothetical protein
MAKVRCCSRFCLSHNNIIPVLSSLSRLTPFYCWTPNSIYFRVTTVALGCTNTLRQLTFFFPKATSDRQRAIVHASRYRRCPQNLRYRYRYNRPLSLSIIPCRRLAILSTLFAELKCSESLEFIFKSQGTSRLNVTGPQSRPSSLHHAASVGCERLVVLFERDNLILGSIS